MKNLSKKRLVAALVIIILLAMSPLLWAQVPPPQNVYNYPQQNYGWNQPPQQRTGYQRYYQNEQKRDSAVGYGSIMLGMGLDYQPRVDFIQDASLPVYVGNIAYNWDWKIVELSLGVDVTSPHKVIYENQLLKMTTFAFDGKIAFSRRFTHVFAGTGVGGTLGFSTTSLKNSKPGLPFSGGCYAQLCLNFGKTAPVGIWARASWMDYNFFGPNDDQFIKSPDHWQNFVSLGTIFRFGKTD